MLETRNLFKVYKPKKGVPVKAIDGISLKFPEKGMVFLLGKSGSGKSTLLNLLGGLDKYDSGEIIIKGVSSKDFKQKHFDSYRNTYVGFIFQEYNILEDFTVGANIALAIELQGRKASDEEINKILKDVDLDGYGNRKPNELSGGQKQRVAIARALVKNPEIIMADEPTGALDSTTGKQIFDTLKKLSAEKLVIVVSHDREFSEQYADRIIELADGHVISDVEYENAIGDSSSEEPLRFDGDIIEIDKGYHLTEEDRLAINKYMDELNSGMQFRIKEKKTTKRFVNTDQSKIKSYNGSDFKLIRSVLPMKNAIKIGASGLKYKKFRLVMTILLSCISFGLFGLADTFGSYNHIKTCTKSLMDSEVNSISLVKSTKMGSGINEWWDSYGNTMSESELKEVEDYTGISMIGVNNPLNFDFGLGYNYDGEVELSKTKYQIYARNLSGFAEINEEKLKELNCTLVAGKLPDGSKDEIAISTYVWETFKIAGYKKAENSESEIMKNTIDTDYEKISEYSDMVGKTILLGNKEYIVTGVIDTNFNLDRYKPLLEEKDHLETSEELLQYALYNEFTYEADYSLAKAGMVGDGFIDRINEAYPEVLILDNSYLWFGNDKLDISPYIMAEFDNINPELVHWLDGERTSLKKNEIILAADAILWRDSNNSYEQPADDELDNVFAETGRTVESQGFWWDSDGKDHSVYDSYEIVGVIPVSSENIGYSGIVVTADEQLLNFGEKREKYMYVVGAMPTEKSEIEKLVSYSYKQEGNKRYEIQNAVTYELDTINVLLKAVSKVFFYIGIGFAVFASILFANFIGTSISHKKQEIGILRAIGSRSNDVFRIFLSESCIIAAINFVISSIGVFVICTIINTLIRERMGILVTVLNFGPRQVLLLMGVSLLVAFIGSFIPVKKIASKKPIEAIRGR